MIAVVQQPLEHARATAQRDRLPRCQRGSRNGPAGVTCTRSSAELSQRRLSALAGAAQQVHVDEQRAAADDLHQLGGRAAPRPAPDSGASGRDARPAALGEAPRNAADGDGRDRRPRLQRRTRRLPSRRPARRGSSARGGAHCATAPVPDRAGDACDSPASTGSASTSSAVALLRTTRPAARLTAVDSLTHGSVEGCPRLRLQQALVHAVAALDLAAHRLPSRGSSAC